MLKGKNMINIRSSVFETNSSSSHSVSLKFANDPDESLEPFLPNSEGKIVLSGGNFTCSEYELTTPQDKADLIAACAVVYGDTELKNSLDKILLEHSGASEIVYDIRTMAIDGKAPNTFWMPKLLNAHCYNYDGEDNEEIELTLKEILKKEDMLKRFLFAKSSYITVEITWS
jgi:hypothetical protein